MTRSKLREKIAARRRVGRLGRTLWLTLFLALLLIPVGCAATGDVTPDPSLGKRALLSAGKGSKVDEDRLRKRARADSFPTPAEVGL